MIGWLESGRTGCVEEYMWLVYSLSMGMIFCLELIKGGLRQGKRFSFTDVGSTLEIGGEIEG